MLRFFFIKLIFFLILEIDGGFEYKDKSGLGGMWFKLLFFEYFEKVCNLYGK